VLRVQVISPERVLFEGEVEQVVAPAFDGELGILGRHAPMMTLLGKGRLRLTGGAAAKSFDVEGGFLQVADDVVRVVTERAADATGADTRA
jgi:F-type H+-transporting ATPase subunit epsilon